MPRTYYITKVDPPTIPAGSTGPRTLTLELPDDYKLDQGYFLHKHATFWRIDDGVPEPNIEDEVTQDDGDGIIVLDVALTGPAAGTIQIFIQREGNTLQTTDDSNLQVVLSGAKEEA
jgi:hypothetical protein